MTTTDDHFRTTVLPHIEKSIDLLSDYCDRGAVTLGADFRDAVSMGKNALVLLTLNPIRRLDNLSIELLLLKVWEDRHDKPL